LGTGTVTLVLSLLGVGAVLFVAWLLGFVISTAVLPRGERFRLERLGWSFAMGCALFAASVPPALALHVAPTLVLVAIAAVLLSFLRRFRLLPDFDPGEPPRKLPAVLLAVLALGVAVYALRALTEPMWANDYIAIWGLKGKTIYGARAYPERFYTSTQLEYSHPEYPLGLPLLYAAVAFAIGHWDDHAMALLFPLFQVGSLVVLFGWLRRRGVSTPVAGLVAALVAWFEPLYSAFLTGMAEVPLAFGLLLFGTALADAIEKTDAGAGRRLVLASLIIAATKNEGLFYAIVGSILALVFGKRRRGKIAFAALAPALLVRALHWPWRNRLPLADFEAGLFSTNRVWDSMAEAGRLLGPSTWLGLALVAVLIVAGRSVPAGNRLLLLAAAGLAAYLVIPAFAVRGPAWLIDTTLLRTAAGLAPLLAAAVAVRYARDETPAA
jgi:hypothetical protein